MTARPTSHAPRGPQLTPGAKAVALTDLRHLVDERTRMVLIGDVHSQPRLLLDALSAAGIIDAHGRRRAGEHQLVSIGDLIDGRSARDLDTLELGARLCDRIIAGNHEAAIMGGPSFEGMRIPEPETTRLLDRLAREERLVACLEHDGMLISHAGLPLGAGISADSACESLTDAWWRFLGRRHDRDPLLFGVPAARGGDAERGGALWAHWTEHLDAGAGARQIIGHNALEQPEGRPDERVICIDVDGDALALCAVQDNGTVRVGLHAPCQASPRTS